MAQASNHISVDCKRRPKVITPRARLIGCEVLWRRLLTAGGGAAMVRSSPQTLGCVGSDAEAEPLMSEPREKRRRPKSKGEKNAQPQRWHGLDKRVVSASINATLQDYTFETALPLGSTVQRAKTREEGGGGGGRRENFFSLAWLQETSREKKRLKIYAGSAAAARRTGMQKRAVRTGVVQADYYGGAVVGSKGAARLMRAPRCNNNRAARATCHLSMIWEGGEYLAGSGD